VVEVPAKRLFADRILGQSGVIIPLERLEGRFVAQYQPAGHDQPIDVDIVQLKGGRLGIEHPVDFPALDMLEADL
jgi:hypothetical protein